MTLDLVLFISGIAISGSEIYNITCSSDLAIQTIRWLKDGQELIMNFGQQHLLLPIERVTPELNNTVYTCEVHVTVATRMGVFRENITVHIDGNKVCFGN